MIRNKRGMLSIDQFSLFIFRQVLFIQFFSSIFAVAQNEVDFWNIERPTEMANIKSLEVMCGKTYMEVQISFDRPFNGIIFSKGAVDQYNCIYVKPQTGSTSYSFNIMYDQCGTKPDMNGKFYENNIVIQYDKDLIEVWDEAKRLRCEWYNDYEKGITKPPIRVSELEVIELNFRGDNVDCWMEIQHGKGPWANLVSGIVPLGTTLTMVIGIKDGQGEFDMRVKSCSAEAENSRPIFLTDQHGCVLRPKMISNFMKIAGADNRASVLTYAFFHAFKFPDSMSVNIKCKVEICRFGCPGHCQKPDSYVAREQDVSASLSIPKYSPGPRYEAQKTEAVKEKVHDKRNVYAPKNFERKLTLASEEAGAKPNIRNKNPPPQQVQKNERRRFPEVAETDKKSQRPNFFGLKFPRIGNLFGESAPKKNAGLPEPQLPPPAAAASYVPLQRTGSQEQPLIYPSLLNTQGAPPGGKQDTRAQGAFPQGPRGINFLKQLTHQRKRRATEEMGVASGYKVISENDLAFQPSFEEGVGVTVFQGRMLPEEVVYGVCIPATGFSALFVLLSLLTIISVLVSGFVCYHRQIQKNIEEGAPSSPSSSSSSSYSTKSSRISNLIHFTR